MAPGQTTVSGSYRVNDTAGIEAFIESKIGANTSGAHVFTYPEAAGQRVWIGVAEGRNT